MKKIILHSSLVLLVAVLISSCVRNTSPNVNENYWLTQERGEVVYSDGYCGYYVVETIYGYTILRSTGSFRPYEGSLIYGNFGNYGMRNFYDRSSGIVVSAEVIEYDLTYIDAQYAIDYYCPIYGRGAEKKAIKNSGATKITRPAK